MEITAENQKLVVGAIYIAFAVPLIPLVLGWWGFFAHGPRLLPALALGILTVSYVWVLAGLAGASVIAPHYTAARDRTIELNFVAALAAIVLLAYVERPMRWYHLVGGCGVCVLWLYVGVVGAVA